MKSLMPLIAAAAVGVAGAEAAAMGSFTRDAMLERYLADESVRTIVLVRRTSGSRAKLAMYEKAGGSWSKLLETPAVIGRDGTGKSEEGDMKTPIGDFGAICAFGIKEDPGTELPYVRVGEGTWCCGDSTAYNRIIDIAELPHDCKGERMIDYAPQYDYGIFLSWNEERVQGRGFAIFMHCLGQQGLDGSTAGCVAIDEGAMVRILKAADRGIRICLLDDGAPDGFVLLSDAAPEIAQEMRYQTDYNFVGRPIDGYVEPRAILTREAADALRRANDEAMSQGYRIKVFDAYRPQRAVSMFGRWAADAGDAKMKQIFYPNIDKGELFKRGFIASKSGHSRGSTVDLTLVRLDDGSEVDMGGPFDLFDPISHFDAKGITREQKASRTTLRAIMKRAGFRPLSTEWWHFTLENEPFPKKYFDFPVDAASITGEL